MGKTEENKSLSQTQFSNPFGTGEIVEQFEPTWVKLDKQVGIIATVIFLSRHAEQHHDRLVPLAKVSQSSNAITDMMLLFTALWAYQ